MKKVDIHKKLRRSVLLNPGPATTNWKIKRALLVDDICPREKEFGSLTKEVMDGLLKVIEADPGKYVSVLFGGSGSLAMESVITSLPDSHEEILIISNGAYGKRFNEIARRYGVVSHYMDLPWGRDIDLEAVEKFLVDFPKIAYVYCTHLETTSGILNDIRQVNKLIHKMGRLSVVDAMASFGAVPIDAKKDGVDFLIASSNKCLQGIPGISFVIGRKKLIEDLKSKARRSFYSNLYEQYVYFKSNNQFQFTPPVQVVYALREALMQLRKEGGSEKRYARYSACYSELKRGLADIGFKFLIGGRESQILLCVEYPDSPLFNFDGFHDRLYKGGYTIYPGKLQDNQKVFRLSVLGDLSMNDVVSFIGKTRKVLSAMGVKF